MKSKIRVEFSAEQITVGDRKYDPKNCTIKGIKGKNRVAGYLSIALIAITSFLTFIFLMKILHLSEASIYYSILFSSTVFIAVLCSIYIYINYVLNYLGIYCDGRLIFKVGNIRRNRKIKRTIVDVFEKNS